MSTNKEILLIPGHTPVVEEIYDALASETRGHTVHVLWQFIKTH
ncbi:hypothetical protein LSPH24S_07550 [Lysinibacillus sphaericus]